MTHAVAPDQIYQENDPRFQETPRRVRVVKPVKRAGKMYWQCENVVTGRKTTIAERRLLKDVRSGYKLVEETP